LKLSQIANLLGCSCPGGGEEFLITRIASPDNADEHAITFLSDPKHLAAVAGCRSLAVIVKKGTAITGKLLLEVADPYVGYALVAQEFESREFEFSAPAPCCIDPSARVASTVRCGPYSVIGPDCIIGEATTIGACCVLERGVKIGAGCRIDSGVVIRRHCSLGNKVIVEAGAIIGSEGFGNAFDGERHHRIPSFGNVAVHDEAWIGAHTTIDRAAFGSTVIGTGVRLDNLIHIAHNVAIGDHCAMAAQVGISGSTTLGKRVMVGGQAGFVGHIHIGDNAFIGAKAGISKSVAPGAKMTGYPAREFMKMRRIEAAQLSLPELLKEVKHLRAEVDSLRNRLDEKSVDKQ
jgi:UDP-3-O-[3-hydroxymyristoyl] glucosamine N-acyltransferase